MENSNEEEIRNLAHEMFQLCGGYTADTVMSAGISIMIMAIEQMIGTQEDLMTVMEQLDQDIFPKIKKMIAEGFNEVEPRTPKDELH